jgi:Ca-activated chloride channel homolog
VLDEIVRSWSTVRKRANLTFVMDVSGSMNDKVSNSPEAPTKLDLAKQATEHALGKLAPDDTLSLWTFSTLRGGETVPYRILVPPGQNSATGGPARAAVAALTPNGGTALYATARASVERVQETYDPNRINAVVLLTDGQNEYPADNDLSRLLTDLASGGQAKPVRVFPVAYGPQANLDVLTQIAHTATGAAYDARVPGTIERVLDDVISNF